MTKTERDLTDGRRHHEAGEFVEAEAIYNRVLKREPNNIHARFFLGALMAQTNRNDEAVKVLQNVVDERPTWEEAHNNLAVAFHNLGRFADALAHYKKASELNPDLVEAHSNATYILHVLKRNEAALTAVDRALEIQPHRFDALLNRSSILKSLGRDAESREALLLAADYVPGDHDTLVKVGVELIRIDEDIRAIDIFEKIVADYPDYAPGYNYLAASLERKITQFTRREINTRMLELLDKCVELAPDYVEGQINRATVLQKLRRNAEAKEIFEKIITEAKERFDVLNNYASVLQEEGRYDEAIDHCRRCIAIDDKYAEPYYNWGACLQLKGNYEGALERYEEALKRNPRHIETHSALSLIYLALGDFERGWEEYEWRKETSQFSGRLVDTHLLQADEDIRGKRVLMHAEQGQGDMFQFVRYAHIIQQLGGEAFIECHDGLLDVMKTCPWVDDVRERSLPDDLVFYRQANLLSLPFIFKTNLDTVPSHVPYLSAPEAARPKWAARMAELTPPGTKLKVGIAWAGNPDHYNDQQRSTTLAKFGAFAGIPGVTFFSVQKGGKPEKQLANPPEGITIVPLGPEIESFADTAAIMEHLDLVISVDTSVVHLAGAMGVPTWTMLPLANDFRWMHDRTDTPWYPTMRLFRQQTLWDYDRVFEEVAGELKRYIADPVQWNIDDAVHKFDRGLREQAKVQLLALTQRYAADTRLINKIGEMLWADGNTQEALQMFTAALQLAPTDRKTIANCAQVLDAFGQKTEARALYHNYVDAHPEDSDFAESLADIGEERMLATAA